MPGRVDDDARWRWEIFQLFFQLYRRQHATCRLSFCPSVDRVNFPYIRWDYYGRTRVRYAVSSKVRRRPASVQESGVESNAIDFSTMKNSDKNITLKPRRAGRPLTRRTTHFSL